MSDVSQIDGSAIRLKRETQGWAIADLASRACLSVKQIRQIEEGGMSAFYSETVKLTAARKVAGLLQMSETQLFGQQLPAVDPPEEETLLHASAHVATPDLSNSLGATPAANPITRSEALHELAQPPENVDVGGAESASDNASDKPKAAEDEPHHSNEPSPVDEAASQLVHETASPAKDSPEAADQPAGNGYLLKIVALFLVALAAAALLRPKVMEDKPEAPAAVETPAPPPALNPSPENTATEASPASANGTNGGNASTSTSNLSAGSSAGGAAASPNSTAPASPASPTGAETKAVKPAAPAPTSSPAAAPASGN